MRGEVTFLSLGSGDTAGAGGAVQGNRGFLSARGSLSKSINPILRGCSAPTLLCLPCLGSLSDSGAIVHL